MASFDSNAFKERGENAQFFPVFGRKADFLCARSTAATAC